MPDSIPVYHGLDERSVNRMAKVISKAFEQFAVSDVDEDVEEGNAPTLPQIAPLDDLIGIDPEVYRQINAALAAGFRHLLFYGPPGTGKTTIAQRVAGIISNNSWKLITGSADFTSQDILGGYIPMQGGTLRFFPGVLLENFDKPFIFDELNRCDIDKVIGPLFTVLSGQTTTLPYLVDPTNPNSQRIEIRPQGVSELPRAYAPSKNWKLIATINSIDKASLYQMSYALTRRFAWIYVDVPKDTNNFIRHFISKKREIVPPSDGLVPLGEIWKVINEVRAIGPAPFIDIIKMIDSKHPSFDYFAPISVTNPAEPYLDGFSVFLLPMLDGILRDQGDKLASSLIMLLMLEEDEAARLKSRILGLTI